MTADDLRPDEENNQKIDELIRAGAERLAGGHGAEAFDAAREALTLRPSHPLASNLLGLALLEQGRNAEAREVFEGLIRRNPDVAPLRINAGLAALGEGELEPALDQFRRAIDLEPTHGRAFGYLALVHLRLGEPGFARAALQEAGLEALADQIGDDDTDAVLRELETGVRALPVQGAAAAHEGFAEAGAIPTAAFTKEADDREDAVEAADDLEDALDQALGETQQGPGQPAPTREVAAEETRRMEIPRGELPEAEPRARTVRLGDPAAEVELQHPLLLVRLNTSETRDGLVLLPSHVVVQRGDLTWKETERRTKGKSEGPFRVRAERLMRAEGRGLLALHPGSGHRTHLFRLDDAGLYLREEALLAFADRLYWENGRIPRAGDNAPAMVMLRGSGFAAAVLRGQLWRVPTTDEETVTVALDHLLGWSPDAVPVGLDRRDDTLRVVFQGAGVLWLDMPGLTPGD